MEGRAIGEAKIIGMLGCVSETGRLNAPYKPKQLKTMQKAKKTCIECTNADEPPSLCRYE